MNISTVKGDAAFIFSQLVAASTWDISHFLGKHPSVTIVDSANTVVQGQIIYHDVNSITVRFTTPFAGAAYLN